MSENDKTTVGLDEIYREACNTVRATDDISLKLLGFVPVFSGSGIALLVKNANDLTPAVTILFVAAGVTATVGLYAWERRNIQTCKFYRDRRDELEAQRKFAKVGDKEPPPLLGLAIGKSGAERLLYGASIVSWLVPLIIKFGCFCLS